MICILYLVNGMEIVYVNKQNIGLAKESKKLFFSEALGDLNDKFFNDDRNIMIVGVVNNEVVGRIFAYNLERFTSHQSQLFIYSMDVTTSHQGNSYWKEQLNKFLTPFQNHECNETFVFTHKNNEKALGLYKACGAKIIESKNGHDVCWSGVIKDNQWSSTMY